MRISSANLPLFYYDQIHTHLTGSLIGCLFVNTIALMGQSGHSYIEAED